MVRRLLNGEIKSVSAAAMILAAASLASRLVGIFRDRILAGEFGAGESLDIYYAAFRLPDLLFQLLIIGALSAGFIPLFTAALHRDHESAWRFAQNIFNILLISFFVFSVVLFLLAPVLVRFFIAPGFSESAQRTTTLLTRIMFLSPILLGASALCTGIAQSFRRFFVTAIAPIFYNLGIMAGALFLVPRYGIVGLAWGVVIGAAAHWIVQIPTVIFLGFRYRFVLLWDAEIRALLRLMVPRILTLGITNIELVVLTAFASALAEGSLSVFNLANNLQSFPIGIIGASYAVAVFPSFSQAVAHGDKEAFTQAFSSTVRQVLFFMIPATVFFIALKAQIVRGIFGAGAFNWNDTVRTFETLEAFAYGFIGQTLFFILVRGFWAYADTIRPALVAVIGGAATLVVAIAAKNFWGVQGLALAISAGATIEVVVLWVLLRRRVHDLDEARIIFSTGKMVVAALCMAGVIQLFKGILAPFFGTDTFFGIVSQGGIAGVIGLLFYVAVLWVLRSSELFAIVEGVRRRMRLSSAQMELFNDR